MGVAPAKLRAETPVIRVGLAIQHEVRIVPSHCLYPPVGPNRSVLIVRASCPSSTRNLETSSTKGVGPQTYIFGFSVGWKARAGQHRLVNPSPIPRPSLRL